MTTKTRRTRPDTAAVVVVIVVKTMGEQPEGVRDG